MKQIIIDAEQGDVDAQAVLGKMYKYGHHGMERDYECAEKWFRQAAEQGDSESQYELGMMYHDGKGVAEDKAAAQKWFRKATKQGHPAARYRFQYELHRS